MKNRAILRNIFRSFGVLAAMTVLMYVLWPMTNFKALWLRIPMTFIVPGILLIVGFLDAATRGEADVAYSELAERIRAERKDTVIHPGRLYWPYRGLISGIGAMALLLLGTLLICLVIQQLSAASTASANLRHQLSNMSIGLFRSLLPKDTGMGIVLEGMMRSFFPFTPALNVPMVAARSALFGYSGFFDFFESLGVLPLALFFFAALFPAVQAVGYLQGPKRRAKVHEDIQNNLKRYKRKQKAMRKKKKKG